jgi:hypothetical protein
VRARGRALPAAAPAAHAHARAAAETTTFLPIHREAPPFSEQSTELEILVTGIKARRPPGAPHRRTRVPQPRGAPRTTPAGTPQPRRR